MTDQTTGSELVPIERDEVAIVRAAPDVAEGFEEYRALQKKLDALMPEAIIKVGDTYYRKKMHWMAIATAFGLDTRRMGTELRIETDDDWGYVFHYQAVAPNGRVAEASGACMASEKRGGQATLHNVMAHAETRAVLRAISNLVGFGEVSADELQDGAGIEPRETRLARKPTAAKRKAERKEAAAPATGGESHFDDRIGWGKYRDLTWRGLCDGEIDGERHGWLKYIHEDTLREIGEEIEADLKAGGTGEAKKNKRRDEKLHRIQKCLERYEQRSEKPTSAEDF